MVKVHANRIDFLKPEINYDETFLNAVQEYCELAEQTFETRECKEFAELKEKLYHRFWVLKQIHSMHVRIIDFEERLTRPSVYNNPKTLTEWIVGCKEQIALLQQYNIDDLRSCEYGVETKAEAERIDEKIANNMNKFYARGNLVD